MNILLVFSYNGKNFSGYQIQPKKRTVQEEIEKVLSQIFNSSIKINASGRTDAKVHAVRQYANFKIESSSLKFSLDELKYRLNKMLPNDIYILDIKEVEEEFHARFAAISKIYEYKFTSISNHDVFKNGLITEISERFDLDKINYIKDKFIGTHNFKNFTSKVEDKDNFVRTIYDIKVVKNDDSSISLFFNGSGFMMYQVRMLAANIVLYSSGRIKEEEIDELLNKDERSITQYCFPPEGLYLIDVKY